MSSLTPERVEAIIQEAQLWKERNEKQAVIIDIFLELLEEYQKRQEAAA